MSLIRNKQCEQAYERLQKQLNRSYQKYRDQHDFCSALEQCYKQGQIKKAIGLNGRNAQTSQQLNQNTVEDKVKKQDPKSKLQITKRTLEINLTKEKVEAFPQGMYMEYAPHSRQIDTQTLHSTPLERPMIEIVNRLLKNFSLAPKNTLHLELGTELGGGKVRAQLQNGNKIELQFIGLSKAVQLLLQHNQAQLAHRLRQKNISLGVISFS